jgi:hypothetical protein
MSKMRTIHSSFISGELSEAILGRTDKEFYASGADKLRNVYVDPLGGVYKREGMRFIDSTQNGGKVKLIEFAFNTEQTYLIVLSDKRMKVYKDDVLVANITSTILDNVTESILSEIKYTQSADTLILVHSAFIPIKITRTSDVAWVVTNIVFDYVPVNPFNGVTVTEPDTSIKFSSLTGQGVYVSANHPIFSPAHIKQKIIGKTGGILVIRKYVDAYTIAGDISVEFPGDIEPANSARPYLIFDKDSWYGTTGGVNIHGGSSVILRPVNVVTPTTEATAECATFTIPNSQGSPVKFNTLTYISLGTPSLPGTMRFTPDGVVGDSNTSKVLHGTLLGSIEDDTDARQYNYSEWQLETGYEDVWSVSRGYPKSCAFYQGRLWFGGSPGRPSTLWGSKSGVFFNFDIGGGQADDAIDVTIDDDRVNGILNIFPGRNLQVFTTGGEFYIPQTETDPIKPENILLQKSTSYGSSKVKPISVDGSTIFIERGGRVVREFVFNDLERSYNASSLSILASHLIQSPVALAVRPSGTVNPTSYVYVVNSDGTIAVLSILRSEKLLAWSLFTTQGIVEDLINVIDKVYLVVKRTIGGVQKRFIEKLDPEYYLDASIVVTNPTPIVNYTGLSVLANQAVKVRSSSFVLADNLISNAGNITIELDYKTIEVGLGFEVLIRLLPIDINLGYKTLTGDWRRIVYALIRTTKSRSFEVHCGNNIFKPVFRNFGSNLLDKPIEPNNGWKKVFLSGGISRDASVDIIQNEPADFDLIAIVIAVTI